MVINILCIPLVICRMLDIQAKKYNDEEPPSLFHQLSRSTSPSKSPQSMTAGEVPPSEDRQFHGSDLIKRSLTVRKKTRVKGMFRTCWSRLLLKCHFNAGWEPWTGQNYISFDGQVV